MIMRIRHHLSPLFMIYSSLFSLWLLSAFCNRVHGTCTDHHGRTSHQPKKLRVDYYKKTCPHVEKHVRSAVARAVHRDPRISGRLLRLHFHDCFVRGCDASVLLSSSPYHAAERDGPPNLSLHSFYVIDNAKESIESDCPDTVSCADILAIAARDAVVMGGGPHWDVLKGRKDGKISNAWETVNLPAPTLNATQLMESFAHRNLSTKDMVALSGAHTLGFSHCSSFNKRLYHFDDSHDLDPTMDTAFAHQLQSLCPEHNHCHEAGAVFDPTPTKFDNLYYVEVSNGRGLMSSDQALFSDPTTRQLVAHYAKDERAFFRDFAVSMVKMGNLGVHEENADGEIRRYCRYVNYY